VNDNHRERHGVASARQLQPVLGELRRLRKSLGTTTSPFSRRGPWRVTRIRETDPAARALVLTTFDTDEDIYRAVKSSAKGYLLKDAPRDILLESIRKVHAGETCLAPELTAKLAGRLSSASLTDREMDVLTLLVRGKGTREIGAALFIGRDNGQVAFEENVLASSVLSAGRR
jgi:ATP/maltotriose-dependent transcriptional regulator MalT